MRNGRVRGGRSEIESGQAIESRMYENRKGGRGERDGCRGGEKMNGWMDG